MTYSPAPTGTPRRIKQMRPDEVAAAISADPRLIIPVGTCEQHGRHLPLGCDTMIVEHLADDLSAEFGVCVAPTLEYGVNVDTERGFPGNASLRKKTLHRMLNDLLDTWESTGVLEFILLTAHEHDPASGGARHRHHDDRAGAGRRRVRHRLPRPARGPVRADARRRGRHLIAALPRAAPRAAWTWRKTI